MQTYQYIACNNGRGPWLHCLICSAIELEPTPLARSVRTSIGKTMAECFLCRSCNIWHERRGMVQSLIVLPPIRERPLRCSPDEPVLQTTIMVEGLADISERIRALVFNINPPEWRAYLNSPRQMYQLIEIEGERTRIQCLVCGLTSVHDEDAIRLCCGQCGYQFYSRHFPKGDEVMSPRRQGRNLRSKIAKWIQPQQTHVMRPRRTLRQWTELTMQGNWNPLVDTTEEIDDADRALGLVSPSPPTTEVTTTKPEVDYTKVKGITIESLTQRIVDEG